MKLKYNLCHGNMLQVNFILKNKYILVTGNYMKNENNYLILFGNPVQKLKILH